MNLNQCTTENCNHFDHLWITRASIARWLAIHGYRTCQIPTELNEAKQTFCICRNYIFFQRGGPELSEPQFLWMFGKRSSTFSETKFFQFAWFFLENDPIRIFGRDPSLNPKCPSLCRALSGQFRHPISIWFDPEHLETKTHTTSKVAKKSWFPHLVWTIQIWLRLSEKQAQCFEKCLCMTHCIVRWSNEHLAKASVFSGIKFKT